MLESPYASRDGKQSGTVKQVESWKELCEEVGKEQALSYANRGWLIAQQATIRLTGVESKTAKLKKALAILRENPDMAEKMGIDLAEL